MRNRKIRILAQDVKLQIVDKVDDSSNLGNCDYIDLTIRAMKEQCPQQMWNTIWHEIIHIGFHQQPKFGMTNQQEECVADAAALIITSVLRDNPWMAEIPK